MFKISSVTLPPGPSSKVKNIFFVLSSNSAALIGFEEVAKAEKENINVINKKTNFFILSLP